MPRPKEDLEKVTIRLYRGDTSVLERFYPNVGYNAAIRQLVRRHIRALEAAADQATAELPREEPKIRL